jgi:hypothetical protein
MTADQRFTIIVALIGVTGGAIVTLGGWLLRTLWQVAGDLRADRSAVQGNTRAIDELTTQLGQLTGHVWRLGERVAAMEGPRGRRGRWADGPL